MMLVEKLDLVLVAAKMMGYRINRWNGTHVSILSDGRSMHIYQNLYYYIDEWGKDAIIVDNIEELKEKLIELL